MEHLLCRGDRKPARSCRVTWGRVCAGAGSCAVNPVLGQGLGRPPVRHGVGEALEHLHGGLAQGTRECSPRKACARAGGAWAAAGSPLPGAGGVSALHLLGTLVSSGVAGLCLAWVLTFAQG